MIIGHREHERISTDRIRAMIRERVSRGLPVMRLESTLRARRRAVNRALDPDELLDHLRHRVSLGLPVTELHDEIRRRR